MAEQAQKTKMADFITTAPGEVSMNLPDGSYLRLAAEDARRVAAHLMAAADEAEGKPRSKYMVSMMAGGGE